VADSNRVSTGNTHGAFLLVNEYEEPACYERLEDYDMAKPINLKAMDDHDLLVMSVMQGNETAKQQERIIQHLDDLNGTVRSDHTWILALRWMVGLLAMALIGITAAGKVVGVW